MGINFHPTAGQVLMCDFAGNKAPEIIKVRPVIVICTSRRPGLVMVVPLSTTAPNPVQKFHHKLSSNPMPGSTGDSWAKCDLVTSVRFERLDRIKVSARNWVTRSVGVADLQAVRNCVAIAAHVQLPAATATATAPAPAQPAVATGQGTIVAQSASQTHAQTNPHASALSDLAQPLAFASHAEMPLGHVATTPKQDNDETDNATSENSVSDESSSASHGKI